MAFDRILRPLGVIFHEGSILTIVHADAAFYRPDGSQTSGVIYNIDGEVKIRERADFIEHYLRTASVDPAVRMCGKCNLWVPKPCKGPCDLPGWDAEEKKWMR